MFYTFPKRKINKKTPKMSGREKRRRQEQSLKDRMENDEGLKFEVQWARTIAHMRMMDRLFPLHILENW